MKNLLHFLLRKYQLITPGQFFLVMTIIFGSLFVVITPPFNTPDEPFHFNRAYQISEGNFIPDYIEGGRWGGQFPTAIGATLTYTLTPDIRYHADQKYDINKTAGALDIKTDNTKKETQETSSAIFTPVMYAPQSLSVLIGRVFDAPIVVMMYMARFAMLLTWAFIFYKAINIMPKRKWPLVFVGLLPMSLFQATALGGDALIIGFGALYLAYILKLREDKKTLARKDIFTLGSITTLMVLSKGVMVLFLPLLLLLPTAPLKKRIYKYKNAFMCAILPVTALIVWNYLIKDINFAAPNLLPNGANYGEQMSLLFSGPQNFIAALWNMYFLSWGDHISRSLIGQFGWMDAVLPISVVALGYVGLFAAFFLNNDSSENRLKNEFTLLQKCLMALLIAAFWLAINTVIYLTNTPVGEKLIYGLQGRYFIPLLVFAIPLLSIKGLSATSRLYRNVVMLFPLALLIFSVLAIWVRYYVISFVIKA